MPACRRGEVSKDVDCRTAGNVIDCPGTQKNRGNARRIISNRSEDDYAKTRESQPVVFKDVTHIYHLDGHIVRPEKDSVTLLVIAWSILHFAFSELKRCVTSRLTPAARLALFLPDPRTPTPVRRFSSSLLPNILPAGGGPFVSSRERLRLPERATIRSRPAEGFRRHVAGRLSRG